jgi:hypothetical protein
MRRLLQFVALAVVAPIFILLTPAPSSAGLLTLPFTVGGPEVAAQFGLLPFQVDADIHNVFGSQPFHLSSGALVDIEVGNGFTTYSYGPGTLTFMLTLEDAGLHEVTGTFTAVTLPFELTVCEGCDVHFGNSNADDFVIEFVSGVFDAPFAQAMRFAQGGHGGVIDFGLEDIDGGPASSLRTGFDHRGIFQLQLDVVQVPEPSALLLALAAAAATYARRGTSRARTSAPR